MADKSQIQEFWLAASRVNHSPTSRRRWEQFRPTAGSRPEVSYQGQHAGIIWGMPREPKGNSCPCSETTSTTSPSLTPSSC